MFVRYTELFRKKGRNIFGTGNSIGILTMAAKRTRAAKMSPSAVSNTLKSGAGMPDLNQFCFLFNTSQSKMGTWSSTRIISASAISLTMCRVLEKLCFCEVAFLREKEI